MKFSIVIATYAPGAQLSQAISSILSQTFQDFEIVIQDNLSTDPETLSVFEKFAEKISLKSTSDSGIYDAFNQALKRCSGDWILFLGADDTLADDTVLEKICAFTDPQFDLILGSIQNLHVQSKWVPHRFVSKMSFHMLWKNTIHQQGCFYKRTWLQKIEFSEQCKILGDYEVHLKALLGHAKVLHTTLIISHCDARGISKKFTKELYDEELCMKKRILPLGLYWMNIPWISFKKWLKTH
jgi:glycosyltransferase involved in cell wall biosynthesis